MENCYLPKIKEKETFIKKNLYDDLRLEALFLMILRIGIAPILVWFLRNQIYKIMRKKSEEQLSGYSYFVKLWLFI